MRKRDKLKNIEQVNLMVEQSYLKTKGFSKDNLINEAPSLAALGLESLFGKKNEPNTENKSSPNEKFGAYFFVPNTDNLGSFEGVTKNGNPSWELSMSPKIDGQPLLGPYYKKNILEFINSGKITNQSYIRKSFVPSGTVNYTNDSLNEWGFPEDFPEFKSAISMSKYNSYQQDVDKKTMLNDFITRFNDLNKIRQKEYKRSEKEAKKRSKKENWPFGQP